MSIKKISWLIIIITVSQLAASCFFGGGADQPPTIELVVWKPFEDEDSLRPIFEAYTQLHPNVHFRYGKKDIATYESDLLNALAAGAGPDIFSIHNDWLAQYVNKMSPAPDGLFSKRELEDNFIDVVNQDLVDANGNLYALPLSSDVLALYYNRDLLGSVGIAQPPSTWNEVIAAVKKLTKQDKLGNFITNGIALGTSKNVNRSSDILSLLMLQNGTQVFNSSRTNATLDREISTPEGSRYNPGVQAVDFYAQFANPATEAYTWNAKNNYSVDAFVGGQVAMILSYSYLVPAIETKAPLLNYGIAPVPQIDLSKPKVNFANYFAEGVSKASPNAATAWDFLKFATGAEQLRKYYEKHKTPSARRDVISEQISDPDIGVFAEGALTAKTFYRPDAARVESILAGMIDDVTVRGKTSQQAVSSANQSLQNLIK